MSPDETSPDPVRFRPATAGDARGIHDLLRLVPLPGRIRLVLDSPAGPIPADGPHGRTIVAVRESAPHEILGLAERTVHRVWLDGAPALVGYVGLLRKRPDARISRRRLADGFRLLEESRQPGQAAFDYTSILSDNQPALRLLGRNLPGLPRYHPAGEIATLTVTTRRRGPGPPRGWDMRPLRPGEEAEARACLDRNLSRRQLAPCGLDPDAAPLPGQPRFFLAREKGTTKGCLALWDRRSTRRIVVDGYSPALGFWRRPLNLLRAMAGAPPLPAPGAELAHGFVSCLAVDEDDPEVGVGLLSAACRAAASLGLDFLSLGLDEAHPALDPVRIRWHPEITRSRLFLIQPSTTEAGPAWRTDLPVQPEIALL